MPMPGGRAREAVLRQDIIRGRGEAEGSQKTTKLATPDVALAGDVVLIT